MVYKEKWPDIRLYSDSKAGVIGLTLWSRVWKEKDRKTGDKVIWERGR